MEEESMHFKRAAPLEHFRPMYESSDFVIVRSMNELVPGINEMLIRCQYPEISSRMKKASEFFVDFFGTSYSERLANFLKDVIAKKMK